MSKILKSNTLIELPPDLYGEQGISIVPRAFFQYSEKNRTVTPALMALLIQSGSLFLVAALFFISRFVFHYEISIFVLVLIQASLSTGLAYFARMEVWWRGIHFLFPIAIWSVSSWKVSNDVYLYGFMATLSLFWTTFRTQVPFYPSRRIVWHQLAELIPHGRPIRMIDIGSGLGDLAMHIAKTRKESQIEGIEIAPLPWLVSKVRSWYRKSTAFFTLGNYQKKDFAKYDVVFAYLSPAAMPALWKKARSEMRPGSMLVSYEFGIPGIYPSFSVSSGNTQLYVWKF